MREQGKFDYEVLFIYKESSDRETICLKLEDTPDLYSHINRLIHLKGSIFSIAAFIERDDGNNFWLDVLDIYNKIYDDPTDSLSNSLDATPVRMCRIIYDIIRSVIGEIQVPFAFLEIESKEEIIRKFERREDIHIFYVKGN